MIVAAVAVLTTACGGSSSSSAGTTTVTAATTSTKVIATTAASTTAAPTTTTTAASVPNDFDPNCIDVDNGPHHAGIDAGSTFGPLGAAPAITIALPTLPTSGDSPRERAAVQAAPTAGGVLLSLSPDPESGSTSTSSLLAAVGFDGIKRWVRCFDTPISGVWASPAGSTALVWTTTPAARAVDPPVNAYRVVSAETGRDVPVDLDQLTSSTVVAASDASLLLGHTTEESNAPDVLYRYDLVTNAIENVPVPTTPSVMFAFDDGGEPTASPDYRATSAIYRDGTWITDTATIDAALGPYVAFDGGEGGALAGHRATGELLWTDPQFTSPGYETSPVIADGSTTVVAACTKSKASCTAVELDGIDTATGKVTWTLPGFRAAPVAADGFAIVNDGPAADPTTNSALTPGWMLIDTHTGTAIPGQTWSDPSLFVQGCCADNLDWVRSFGGAIVAQSTDVVRIWLPKAITPASALRLALP